VRYRDLDITKGDIKLTLLDRVLKLSTEKLTLAQGTIDSATTLDASSGGAKLDAHAAIAEVQARPLLKTFAGNDRLGGTIAFETTIKGNGKNEKELISSLDGTGHVKVTDGAIYGINLAQTLRKAGTLGFGSSTTEKTDQGRRHRQSRHEDARAALPLDRQRHDPDAAADHRLYGGGEAGGDDAGSGRQ
jgi:AsmA protein